MFGLDDQLRLLGTWNEIALDCITAATQISTAMLGLSVPAPSSTNENRCGSPELGARPVTISRQRSWYREPERNPLEASWLGTSWPFPMPFSVPVYTPPQYSLQPWSDFLRWGPANHSGLFSQPTSWFAAGAFAWMPFASQTQQPDHSAGPRFSAYRSDSGHAVAQLTFPNQVVAAVAVPATTVPALDTFMAWSRLFQ